MERKKNHYQPMVVCPNNEYVHCYKPRDCFRCGWNPEVEKARTAKYNSQFKKEKSKWNTTL